jgi:hypothetical protein
MTNEMSVSPNSYQSLLSMHNLALLSDWLAENGELLVDINWPHRGGSGQIYIIKSLLELRNLLTEQTWPEIHMLVFRAKQYPLRGTVNESFIAQVVESIIDGHQYVIVKFAEYPATCEWLDDGNSRAQLKEQLENLKGEIVGIGPDPLERIDLGKIDSHKNVFSLRVSKNQNYYERYAKKPEQYAHIAEEWASVV